MAAWVLLKKHVRRHGCLFPGGDCPCQSSRGDLSVLLEFRLPWNSPQTPLQTNRDVPFCLGESQGDFMWFGPLYFPSGSLSTKDSFEYWISKGPPSTTDQLSASSALQLCISLPLMDQDGRRGWVGPVGAVVMQAELLFSQWDTGQKVCWALCLAEVLYNGTASCPLLLAQLPFSLVQSYHFFSAQKLSILQSFTVQQT